MVASRSHGDESALDAFLAGRPVASRTNAGSSLKLCLVAAGEADVYPRLGRTMEWDIAAGDADWTVSRALRQECDAVIEISAGHLRPYVDLIPGAEPAIEGQRRAIVNAQQVVGWNRVRV